MHDSVGEMAFARPQYNYYTSLLLLLLLYIIFIVIIAKTT